MTANIPSSIVKDADRPSTSRRRKGLWFVTAAVVLALVVVGGWLMTSKRVFFVIPNEVLRSRQLDSEELRDVIEDRGLHTVISLRGGMVEKQWLADERRVCADMGVRHEVVSLKPDDWPARHEVRRLVDLFQSSEPPILLHCYRGVDRTGWASAVSCLLDGQPLDEALVQLSPRYGHICDRESCPLHLFFDSYHAYLQRRALAGSSEDFRIWVLEDYCPEPYNARLDLLSELPNRVSPGERIRATVRAINHGSFSWRMTDLETTGVRLGARIIGPFDSAPDDAIDILRTPNGPALDLARSGLEFGVMGTGVQRDFEIRFSAPKKPGIYVLQLDMVDELVHWFSDLGFPGLIHELEVIDPEAQDPVPVGAS